MSIKDQTTLRVVLYEGEGSEPFSPQDRMGMLSALLEKGFTVTKVTAGGNVAPGDRSSLLVVGKFVGETRPVSDNADRVKFLHTDSIEASRVLALVEEERTSRQAAKHGDWKPWFPVIDYDRCTNCMQCLSFCLFNVYGVDDQHRIQVQNNDNCKTNCPACSRVCPEAAIMFPKYKAGPINGDIVTDADLQREKMKIDVSALLGGDVYAMLRDRSERAQSRFSKERDSEKALKERQKCLVALAKMGDIPAEVLMSLPSPEEILKRAEEAKNKAASALQANGHSAATSL